MNKNIDADYIARNAFGGLGFFMIILGTVCNSIAFCVCIRKRLRVTPTFIFMAFICLIDTFPLYTANLDSYFHYTFFTTFLSDISYIYCKIEYFMHFSSLKSSSWLLVLMSFEAFMCIQVKTWRLKHFNSMKAIIASATVVAFFGVTDFYLNFVNHFQTIVDRNTNLTKTICIDDEVIFNIWATMNLYLYSIIPFILMFILNSICIYKTHLNKKKSLQPGTKKQIKRMAILVLSKTVLFFIFTTPIAIANGYFVEQLEYSEEGFAILSFLNVWRLGHHGLNLILLLVFNKKFREEVRLVLSPHRRNQVGVTKQTTQSLR